MQVEKDGETWDYIIEGVYLSKILHGLGELKGKKIMDNMGKNRFAEGYLLGVESAIGLVVAITGLPLPEEG